MVDLSILMSYVNVSKIEGIFGVVKFTPSNGAFVAAIPNHDGGMRREASHLSPFFFSMVFWPQEKHESDTLW
jgi:hypothetical protein